MLKSTQGNKIVAEKKAKKEKVDALEKIVDDAKLEYKAATDIEEMGMKQFQAALVTKGKCFERHSAHSASKNCRRAENARTGKDEAKRCHEKIKRPQILRLASLKFSQSCFMHIFLYEMLCAIIQERNLFSHRS